MSAKGTGIPTSRRRRFHRGMAAVAGRAASLTERSGAPFESLEPRVMLSGDHPSYNDVFVNGAPADPVVLNGAGVGALGGVISPALDNDMFRFTAPQNDFVRVWADTVNSSGSNLDTRLQVYTLDAGNNPVIVATGSNNGTLTSGVFKDGWVGFVAQANRQYFVKVESDAATGLAATGAYTLRVNAKSLAFPALNGTTGDGQIAGTLAVRGGDVVYLVTTPNAAAFDSLMTVTSLADATQLDTRLDVYASDGSVLRFANGSPVLDDDAGNLSNSYLAFKATKSTQYYVRVRSDKLAAGTPSTGNFTLEIDSIGDAFDMDPVSRLGGVDQFLNSEQEPQLYQFQTQGTGRTFISLTPTGLAPIPDSALRLYDETGTLIAFNELPGAASQIVIDLTGGRTLYLVVENFDGAGAGEYIVEIEAHHTWTPAQGQNPVDQDDHENTPANGVTLAEAQRAFERATPILWGDPVDDPFLQGPPPNNDPPNHSQVVIGHATGRIYAGGDTDLFQFVPPQDMMGTFGGLDDGGMPPLWQPRYRPAGRLQILVSAVSFNDMQVRVFDSNLNVVWTNAALLTTQPDPAGMLDPASFDPPPIPGFVQGQPDGITVWGGEVYYLEVSSVTGGNGRYNVEVMTDAPTDTNLWTYDLTPTHAGDFANAMDMNVDAGTGETNNYANVAAWGAAVDPMANLVFLTPGGAGNMAPTTERSTFANRLLPVNNPPIAGTGAGTLGFGVGSPGTRGRVIFEMSDLGNIQGIRDTQLYKFRALYTGTAEIRVNSTNLADEFLGVVGETEGNDGVANPPNPQAQLHVNAVTSTGYNSPLDSALRIFDNDFQQIAFNNDSTIVPGESITTNTGSFANKTFYRRDAAVVVNVEAGKEYYVQVESGQAQSLPTPDLIDWRHATGSYELLVNSMPNLTFNDDHVNIGVNAQATPIPMDLSQTNPNLPMGTIDGTITNVPVFNPLDSDLFQFFAPAGGTAKITVTPRGGDSFGRTVIVTDVTNNTVLGTATAAGTTPVTISVQAKQGQKFLVSVAGSGAQQQGRYTLTVSGLPVSDDHANESHFAGATVIDKDLYDFDKTETVQGTIENTGDTDVFSFDSLTYDLATITVHSRSAGFNPFFRVYEQSEDPDGNVIRLQVGYGVGTFTNDATTTVSLTRPRVSRLTNNDLHTYYIVVSGVDPNVDIGAYDLTLTVGVATDDHPDANQFTFVRNPEDTITLGQNGTGGSTGDIEESGDTDLFKFSPTAGGIVTVTVLVPSDSLLHSTVQILDAAGNPMTDIGSGLTIISGTDDPLSIATFRFVADRSSEYFVLVGGTTGNNNKPDDHGHYLVNVTTPIPDDHPNEGEFTIADPIFIAPSTGLGAATGVLETLPDTDLFQFVALGDGNATITISTPASGITPVLRLFDSSTTEIGTAVVDGGPGDEDTIVGSVTRTIPVNELLNYYILVGASPQSTGGYSITVNSPRPNTAPPDDHANAGDWNNATFIPLAPETGDGSSTGVIEASDDTDLFFFTSLAGSISSPRSAFVQVVTSTGSVIDVGVKIFDPTHQLVSSDTVGGPGFNAGARFLITGANLKYFIEVDGITDVGDYTVRVATGPETFTLYYPEGFSNDNIKEYVSIGNANDFDVHYTIKLHYELSGNEVTLVSNATIQPHTRGGITISDGLNGRLPGVDINHGYAITIESDGFLGANISHYDFHATLGEAFTSVTSDIWAFARGDRVPGSNRDFVVTYNPNNNDVDMTFTAYRADGTTFSMTQTVAAHRRGGWTLAGTPQLGVGQFAFTVTSAPHTPGDPHIGVVASLSHYDLITNSGYGVLGDPSGGSTVGVVPGVMESSTVHTTLTFFNTTTTAATVGIVVRYIGAALPDIVRQITVNPRSAVNLAGADLGLTANQLAGVRYDSTVPLTVIGGTIRPGSNPPDATVDITQANTDVASDWFFGDAFINRKFAGTLYSENMFLYNPDVNPLSVTLTFVFNDGFRSSVSVVVGAKNFASVALHQLAQILNHKVFNFFSVEASASGPFAAKMNHYDLVLDGAWGTKGAPLGLTNPLSTT